MCGIVGVVESHGRVDRRQLEAMNQSMVARGPDGAGYFYSEPARLGMAMRRLSIIDLAGGWQPLYNEDRSIAAMQNGEIYNYQELRLHLEGHGHRFATQSDTEILAHGYEQWGIRGLLERVDGMFALAIYDRSREQLHLARDRFGEKPLYYHAAPGRFVYASQLLTVASYPGVDCRWDTEGLYLYLGLHFVPGDVTILRGVRKLRPGHWATVDVTTGHYQIQRYWRLSEQDEQPQEPERLLEEIDTAVRTRLVADVPVGVFLSGGIDSSLVTALAVRHLPQVATFSMGFGSPEHDESPYAEWVARTLGTCHHHFRFDGQSFLELLPRVVAAMDEPVGDQAMLPLYWLCREAAGTVRVVLGGEGADELFAGYSYYGQGAGFHRASDWLTRCRDPQHHCPQDMSLLLDSNQTPSGFPLLTTEQERRELLGLATYPSFTSWHADLMEHWIRAKDDLRRACLTDIETWLPDDLMMKFDKMAMANSLEGRAPFLAPSLAELAFHLPAHQKLAGKENKRLLREAARTVLPRPIAERRKQGFVLPMGQWIAAHFTVADALHDFIEAGERLGLDRSRLNSMVTEDLGRGVTRERLLYALLVLTRWSEQARAQLQLTRTAYPSGSPTLLQAA